jgi:O-antigen/teichoic acid export membrane protein
LTNWPIRSIGKGAVYLYVENIVAGISGYAFWLIISKIVSPEIIGISSSIVSFSTILAVIAAFGIPNGIPRFLGRSFSEENISEAKRYVKVSIILVSGGILACTVIILVFRDWMYQYLHTDSSLLVVLIVLLASSILFPLFRSVVVSTLKTKVLLILIIVSSIVRIISAVTLLILGWGAAGVTIGYAIGFVISSALLGITLNLKLKSAKESAVDSFNQTAKNILSSSTANWVPALVTAIGYQLGTLIVFGVQGSQQAGIYFIALTLATGITLVAFTLLTITFPVLSSMQDGRKRFAWRVIRLSLVIAVPFSTSLIFYSQEIMQLIGQSYVAASFPMQILLSSLLPATVATGISVLVYAYGRYKQVLTIGLATNVPRTILYFLLIQVYGNTGAALSYTIGDLAGFAISIIIARRMNFQIFWKDLGLIMVIPTGIAFTMNFLGLNYIIGMVVTVVLSYILFLKLEILTNSDIVDMAGILPGTASKTVIRICQIIDRALKI